MIICCLPTLLFLLDCYTKATLITWFLQYIHNIYIYVFIHMFGIVCTYFYIGGQKDQYLFPLAKVHRGSLGHWVSQQHAVHLLPTHPGIHPSIHLSICVSYVRVYTYSSIYIYIHMYNPVHIYIFIQCTYTHTNTDIYSVYIDIHIYIVNDHQIKMDL